ALPGPALPTTSLFFSGGCGLCLHPLSCHLLLPGGASPSRRHFASAPRLPVSPLHGPPLPVPRNFPFQFAATGIHSSILMSESLDGFSVAWIRQSAGRFANWLPPRALAPPWPPLPDGGVSAPGATFCASVIVVFRRDSLARSSQAVAACAGLTKSITSKNATAQSERDISEEPLR